MPARLIANAKEIGDDGSLIELVVWELPQPIPPRSHCYKYRLYYGSPGGARVRSDSERGKRDHRQASIIIAARRSAGCVVRLSWPDGIRAGSPDYAGVTISRPA